MRASRVLALVMMVVLASACWPFASRAPAVRHPPPPKGADVGFVVDDHPVAGAARITSHSRLRLVSAVPLRRETVTLSLDGAAIPDQALGWSADATSVAIPLDGLLPYRSVSVELGPHTAAVGGKRLALPAPLLLRMLATLPSNPAGGVGPGFQPRTPMQIVVENSPPARPQSGLQDADIVYEYLSEYDITRMTATYFNRIPDPVGPARSCRMINPYLAYAFVAVVMCTGVSDGTAAYIYGTVPQARPVPNLMEQNDQGGHFFRVGFRAAPHNAYTGGARAEGLRSELQQPPCDYAVDPPHDDVMAGQPADPPSVPAHAVSYSYDGGSRQYLRADHGYPFVDQNTGQQLHVKNVILLHVPSHDAGWVEDENGGAHSIWYDMTGSGPAEIYSNGLLVHAAWHMGAAGQGYFENHTPVWFTDEAGRVMTLNSGLTWLHVV